MTNKNPQENTGLVLTRRHEMRRHEKTAVTNIALRTSQPKPPHIIHIPLPVPSETPAQRAEFHEMRAEHLQLLSIAIPFAVLVIFGAFLLINESINGPKDFGLSRSMGAGIGAGILGLTLSGSLMLIHKSDKHSNLAEKIRKQYDLPRKWYSGPGALI